MLLKRRARVLHVAWDMDVMDAPDPTADAENPLVATWGGAPSQPGVTSGSWASMRGRVGHSASWDGAAPTGPTAPTQPVVEDTLGKALLQQQDVVTRSLVPTEKTAADFLPHFAAVFSGGVVVGLIIGGILI